MAKKTADELRKEIKVLTQKILKETNSDQIDKLVWRFETITNKLKDAVELEQAKPFTDAIIEFNQSTDEFVMWKKVRVVDTTTDWIGGRATIKKIVCRLIVPAHAKRLMAISQILSDDELQNNQIRVSEAIVDGYENLNGTPLTPLKANESIRSLWEWSFMYPKVGETVKPHRFDRNKYDCCVAGIHGYTNLKAARKY